MKHPSREEMMEHLYQENSPAQRQSIDNHLRTCADCRAQSDRWHATMKTLDAWPLEAPRRRHRTLPAVPWAIAALLVVGIGVGFLTGRTTAIDSPALQAALRQEVASQLTAAMNQQRASLAEELRTASARAISDETRQLFSAFAEQLEERRESDAEVIYSAIQQVDTRHSREVARLRRDLGTVAVVADARITDAQEQISNLSNPGSESFNK
jgi:hypothetical protein